MRPRYVVDTNVLIGASAINPDTPIAQDATPKDPALRLLVHAWLTEFESSRTRMVLDWQGKIQDEYGNKLGFNDYGRQVVLQKMSTSAVDFVDVLYDDDGHGYLDDRWHRWSMILPIAKLWRPLLKRSPLTMNVPLPTPPIRTGMIGRVRWMRPVSSSSRFYPNGPGPNGRRNRNNGIVVSPLPPDRTHRVAGCWRTTRRQALVRARSILFAERDGRS